MICYDIHSYNFDCVVESAGFVHVETGQNQLTSLERVMDLLRDLWGFLKTRKKFWLLPIIIFMLLFGVLLFMAGGSALAPFIYTIF